MVELVSAVGMNCIGFSLQKKNEVVGKVLPKHTQSCNNYFYAIFKFLSCSRTQKTPRFAALKTLNTRYKPIICEILLFFKFFFVSKF